MSKGLFRETPHGYCNVCASSVPHSRFAFCYSPKQYPPEPPPSWMVLLQYQIGPHQPSTLAQRYSTFYGESDEFVERQEVNEQSAFSNPMSWK